MDQQREELPRISVDSLHDWERIKASYTDAAMATFETRVASRSEADKKLLRKHLQKFIDRTFEMSTANLRINGRNFEDLNAEEQGGIEPFDEGLDRHIWSLSDQSLQWDGEIAKKRREKPREVHRLMKELLETQQVVDEAETEEYAQVVEGDDEIEADSTSSRNHPNNRNGNPWQSVTEAYNEAENVSRKTYAVAEELQQVRQHSFCLLFVC
ncbi:hypothetical protein PHLCEN_2v2648 [Hermanssonia centrifuga]|uniref:Uncharacterized protein n=1 Tax=Hermanssonia centrifuga TaxID=98765 RepID=A0A2R6RIL5_9APHY|nr:hypothetical protein PHLCEN_2v2648 [Hermanssonia centrifuga]